MSVKGNPKLCPQKSFNVDTQTSDVEDTVSEGKEVSGDSSESYVPPWWPGSSLKIIKVNGYVRHNFIETLVI